MFSIGAPTSQANNGRKASSLIEKTVPGWGGNLLSFLLRCGTRPYERGTQ